jgi:hypothetical protein
MNYKKTLRIAEGFLFIFYQGYYTAKLSPQPQVRVALGLLK